MQDNLRTHAITVAYLFGPPRDVGRAEAIELNSRLASELVRPSLSFHYHAPAEGHFEALMQEDVGQLGGFEFRLLGKGEEQPLHVTLKSNPATEAHAEDDLGNAARTLWEVLDGTWTVLVSEVRIIAQCSTKDPDAKAFLRESVFRCPKGGAFRGLDAEPDFLGFRIRTPLEYDEGNGQVKRPTRDIQIESHVRDPGDLFLNIMTQYRSQDVRHPAKVDPPELIQDIQRFTREKVLDQLLSPESTNE